MSDELLFITCVFSRRALRPFALLFINISPVAHCCLWIIFTERRALFLRIVFDLKTLFNTLSVQYYTILTCMGLILFFFLVYYY